MGHHLPPIIVLLTSSVRGGNAQPLKLQALEGWRALVKALAKHSPSQLSDVANQVTLPLVFGYMFTTYTTINAYKCFFRSGILVSFFWSSLLISITPDSTR